MAEGGGLLNRYTPQRRIEGSNPSVSATGLCRIHCESVSRINSRLPAATVNHRGSPRVSDGGVSRDKRGGRHLKSFGAKNKPPSCAGIFR